MAPELLKRNSLIRSSSTSLSSSASLDKDFESQVKSIGSKSRSGPSLLWSTRFWPMLVLFAAQTIFSGWHVLSGKTIRSTPYVSPVSFTALRQICSYFVLFFLSQAREGGISFPKANTAERYKVIVAGICGGSFMPMFYLKGVMMTTPTVGSIWDAMIPVVVFIVTLSLGIESLSQTRPITQVVSLVVTILGSFLVLVSDFHHHKASHKEADTWHDGKFHEFLQGNFILVLMVFSYATMALMLRSLAKSFPPLTLTCWIFGIGSLTNVTVVVLSSSYTGLTLWVIFEQTTRALTESKLFLVGLLYAVFLLNVGNYTAISYALKYLESTVVTLFSAAQPPITVVLEAILFGKPIALFKVLGILMVFLGMHCFTSAKKAPYKEKEASLVEVQLIQPRNRALSNTNNLLLV